MDIKGPAYSHNYASQPMELIVKTQAAKELQMNIVEQTRRRTELTVRQPQKALANSYEGHAGTYGADGKKMHIPQVEGVKPKSIDIQV